MSRLILFAWLCLLIAMVRPDEEVTPSCENVTNAGASDGTEQTMELGETTRYMYVYVKV
jgi:hypothetical protein